jgi:hypothetical protein
MAPLLYVFLGILILIRCLELNGLTQTEVSIIVTLVNQSHKHVVLFLKKRSKKFYVGFGETTWVIYMDLLIFSL